MNLVDDTLCNRILDVFYPEYGNSTTTDWIHFIRSKDIGLECSINENKFHWDYKIINDKKWNYTKIKYEL
jgi:hypothetical protein